MKKGLVLSLLVIFLITIFPKYANASLTIVGSDTSDFAKNTSNSDDVRIKNNNAQTKIFIGAKVDGTTKVTEFKATLTLSDSSFEFVSVTPGRGWKKDHWQEESPGVYTMIFTRTDAITAATAGANGINLVATVTVNGSAIPSVEDCAITLGYYNPTTPSTPGKCEIVGGKYYCDVNKECTKEQYDAQCPKNTDNPQTGSFLPYAVIVGGIAVAVGLYVMTKKNKIYHI